MSWHRLLGWLPSPRARRPKRAQTPVPPWRFVVPCLERLESRIAPAPVPTVTLPPPTTVLIGDTEQMSVTFSNTGDATGYGPFVDVELPTAGNVPASSNGLSYVSGSATYLGLPVQTQVLTFDASGHVTHPFLKTSSGQPAVITGTPGDELVVFTLPLGSFTPGEPPATIDFSTQLSTLATLNVPLSVTATGGFQFAADPENDPTADPPIVGSTTTTTVTPTLFQIQKTYLGPEQETATGPNFVQQFQVSVRVAAGQTITNFDLKDVLPDNMQFVSVNLLNANGATQVTEIQTPSTSTPGGILEGLFDQVVGTGSATDVVVDGSFYIPEFDAAGNPVLPPGTGINEPVINNVSATGTFTPLPGSGNTGGTVTGSATATITAKQVATQKSVQDITNPGSSGPSRGDTLQYTINFQVSDFFALQNLIATDLLSDGQSFDTTFTPTISYTQHGQSFSGAFSAGAFSDSRNTTTTGQTTVSFNVSQALAALGLPSGDDLVGGDVPAPGDTHNPPFGGTTGTITFRAVIDNNFLVQPSPNAPVVQGDQFGDNASVSAAVLDNATLTPTGNRASDGTSATVTIPHGVFTKSVYAVNGVVGASPNNVTVGDTVTYELKFTLPAGNVKDYQLSDYLPLPIFPISSMTFVPGQPIPVVNTATFGPDDTFFAASGIVPTTTVNTATNSVNFNFGSFSSPSLANLTSDVLFTVKVGDTPFADGLFLSNLGVASEDSNTGGSFSSSAIAPIKLNEPSLEITKGVVSTNSATAAFTTAPAPPGVTFAAPGSTTSPPFTGIITTTGLASSPIDADLTNAEGNDLVRFAIVVENVGAGQHGAFNVTIADAFPTSPVPNYTLVPGSLQVDNGAGDPLAFTGNLFTGITLSDPSATMGSLGPGATTSGAPIDDGSNIAVITYDVKLDPNVQNRLALVNTSTLTNYTGSPTGGNFVPQGLTAQATVVADNATVTKQLLSTSIINPDNTLTQAAIGERVDYLLTALNPVVSIPNAMLVDDLRPINLAYVNNADGSPDVTITASPGVSFSVTPTPVLSNNGQTLTINFGTITNNAGPNAKVTVSFEAVVLDVAANHNGVTFVNTAVTTSANGSQTVTSAPVTIIEPKLTTTKKVSIAGGGTAQGGSTVTYTMTIAQAASSTTDAYNTTYSDALPLLPGGGSVLLNPSFTVSDPLGLVTSNNFQLTGSNAAGYVLSTTPTGDFDLLKSQKGRVITLTVTGTVSNSVVAGEKFANTDNIQWTSLPGNPVVPSDNPNATERTGSGGVNSYHASASATFVTAAPSIQKSLLTTSIINANNGLSQAVIGEQVQYKVTVIFPDGIIPNTQLVDQLPAGLAFVKLVSFTNNNPNDLSFTGDPSNPVITNNGHTITVNLGTVTNLSTNPNIVDSFSFISDDVVLNVPGNVAGTTLTNVAQVFWNNGANKSNTVSAAPITVIEPKVITTKSVSFPGSAVEGGTPVTYTITLSQANTVDANNVALTDLLPLIPGGGGSVILNPTFIVSDPFGRTATNANFQLTGSNATGWTLSSNPADPLNLINLEPNRVVTITVTGTAANNIVPGEQFTNTDNVQWTSLPGPDPGQISPFNTDSTERTGSGAPDVNSINNYFTSDSATFIVAAPSIDKELIGTSIVNANNGLNQAVIGELVEYQVTVKVPDVELAATQLVDQLPAGLAFVKLVSFTNNDPNDLTFTGDPTSPSVTNNGQKVTFNLGNVTNSSTDPTVPDTFTFDYDAVVLDVASNVAGTTLSNVAQLFWNNGDNHSNTESAAPVIVIEPQVTTTKSVGGSINGGFIPGDTITYTITLQQANNVDANNVTLTDLLPHLLDGSSVILNPTFIVSDPFGQTATNANFQLTGSNATGWTLSSNPADPLNLIDSAPNRVATITITGTVSPNVTPGLIFTNTDDVQWTSLPGPNPGQISAINTDSMERTGTGTPAVNDYFTSASALATISQFLDLAITKTVSNPHPAVGQQDTFTVVLTNNGPSDGTGVVVNDPLPPDLAFVSDKPTPGTTYDPTTGVWTVGNLAVGAFVTLTLTVQNNSPNPQTNTAIASSIERDINLINNTDSASEEPLADLVVVKTVDDARPQLNQQITFTLVASNNGPGDASGVTVTDPLPPGLAFVSDIAAPPTTYDPATGVWTIGQLAVGARTTLTITAQVDTVLPVTNVATVGGREPDPDLTNNTSSVIVTPQEADLSVTKLVNQTTPIVGTPVVYTLIVHNNGPTTATDVVVTDPLPTGFVFVSATPSQGSFDPGAGQWIIGTLPNGATATLQIVGIVVTIGPITNSASVKADQFDPDLSNNASSVTIDGLFAPGQISKSMFLSSGDAPLNPAMLAAEEAMFNALMPLWMNLWNELISLAQNLLAARDGPGNGGIPVLEGSMFGSPLMVYADPLAGQITAVQDGATDFLFENNAVAGVRML
ncbi:MAG TPA: isopeptide-forming domain-containing fimbrial protein [Gemmataceae bacterium]|jgi:uncharacterized repeat protein (TIGR01451 family)/fimbrial isopeptide formation D2 family protein